MDTIKDEDLDLLANSIEEQYAFLDADEWYRLLEIMMKRASV